MDVRDLESPHEEVSPAWFGTVSTAPEDLGDTMLVILPEYDETLQWGPCFWMPRDNITLPNVGDRCLVIIDNRRNAWVTAWWPFS